MSGSQLVPRRGSRHLVIGVITGIAAIGLFAWDTEKDRGSDGNLHGPYSPWQVALMMSVLLAVAVYTGLGQEALPGAASAAAGTYVGVVTTVLAAGGAAGGIAAGALGIVIGAVLSAAVFVGVLGIASIVASLASRCPARLPWGQ